MEITKSAFPDDRLLLPLLTTLLSTLFWTTLYLLARLLLKTFTTRAEWAARIVNLLNGALVIKLCVQVIGQSRTHYITPGTRNTDEETGRVCFALGYFLYDLGMFILHKNKKGFFKTVSHLLVILTLTIVLLSRQSATEVIIGMLIFMLTNPVLMTFEVMRDLGFTNTLFTSLYLAAFGISFGCQLLEGAYFTYQVCTDTRPELAIKLCVLGLLGLSWCRLAMLAKRASDTCFTALMRRYVIKRRVQQCEEVMLGEASAMPYKASRMK